MTQQSQNYPQGLEISLLPFPEKPRISSRFLSSSILSVIITGSVIVVVFINSTMSAEPHSTNRFSVGFRRLRHRIENNIKGTTIGLRHPTPRVRDQEVHNGGGAAQFYESGMVMDTTGQYFGRIRTFGPEYQKLSSNFNEAAHKLKTELIPGILDEMRDDVDAPIFIREVAERRSFISLWKPTILIMSSAKKSIQLLRQKLCEDHSLATYSAFRFRCIVSPTQGDPPVTAVDEDGIEGVNYVTLNFWKEMDKAGLGTSYVYPAGGVGRPSAVGASPSQPTTPGQESAETAIASSPSSYSETSAEESVRPARVNPADVLRSLCLICRPKVNRLPGFTGITEDEIQPIIEE